MSTQPDPFLEAEIDPSIDQDPIALLHYWLNLPTAVRSKLTRELELRLLALQVQALDNQAVLLDELVMAARDLVEIFKLRK